VSGSSIDGAQLLGRIQKLGQIGRDGEGRLTRLAGSDADKQGRDALAGWMREAGLEVVVDRIGNMFGISPGADAGRAPVLIGSHIDTVIDAGVYDGCYGVLAGLAVIEALGAANIALARRYSPMRKAFVSRPT